MPDSTHQNAHAFSRLRRALIVRRLRRLDPVLRLELALRDPRASHVVETVERLCDQVVVLHLGRIVRTLTRAAWGGPERGPSPLEREFLSIIQNPPARENPP